MKRSPDAIQKELAARCEALRSEDTPTLRQMYALILKEKEEDKKHENRAGMLVWTQVQTTIEDILADRFEATHEGARMRVEGDRQGEERCLSQLDAVIARYGEDSAEAEALFRAAATYGMRYSRARERHFEMMLDGKYDTAGATQ